MNLLMAYLVAPLVLVAVCLGAGQVLAWLAPRGALGPLIAPLGLVLIVVAGTLMTFFRPTARWTTPVIVAIAAVGLAVWILRRRRDASATGPVDWWPVAVGVLTFALFAAPVVLSGEATWAGWVKLDDSASWLGFTDWLMTNGKTLPDPMTSTYERLIDVNFRGTGAAPYPTGAFPPLGVLSQVTGLDPAWLLHVYMCVLGALLGLALYRVLRDVITVSWLRAGAAILATQAATLVAYVLWGGLKEILLPVLLAVLAVTAAEAGRQDAQRRMLVLPVLSAVSFLTVTGSSGMGYVLPLALAAILIAWVARNRRTGAIAAAAVVSAAVTGVVLLAAGALPSRLSLVPTIPDIGNLFQPLSPWQSAGVWIGADFRIGPEVPLVTAGIIAIVVALAIAGLVAAVRDRAWPLPLFTGTALLVMAYSQVSGGAWLAGKAIAVASPGVIAAAMAGAFWLWRRWPSLKVMWIVGATAVVIGVGWSNSLAFRTVWLAPVPSQAELEAIGREFAGQGPALMTDFSIFGGRHFLRDLDTEVAAELRVNPIPLRDGSTGQKGESFDIVAFPPSTLEEYPVLVLRRSPTGTRAPAGYSLVRPGRFYDVWIRNGDGSGTTIDVPLSGPFAVAPELACAAITDLASGRPGSDLVAGMRRQVVTVPLDTGTLPEGWVPGSAGSGTVIPSGPGEITAAFDVPTQGEYEVWLGGSFPGQVSMTIDGSATLTGEGVIEFEPASATPLGSVILTPGTHELVLAYDTPWWRPGSGAGPFPLGPMALTALPRSDGVLTVPAAQAADLCGADIDWVSVRDAP